MKWIDPDDMDSDVCNSAKIGNKVRCILTFFSILVSSIKNTIFGWVFWEDNNRIVCICMLSVLPGKNIEDVPGSGPRKNTLFYTLEGVRFWTRICSKSCGR